MATNFLNNGDISVDEGAFEVTTSSTTGATLGNAVGWDGFAWNQSVTPRFHASATRPRPRTTARS